MNTKLAPNRLAIAIALATLVTTAATANAGHIAVSAQADVRVWVEGGDVFDSYGDVAIWLRPERDCYTTLFMVDTDGYMHVLYPSSSYDDTWLYGGRSYCYRASELGLDRLDGAGIAYVFAVGSPVPFDYSVYGAGVFVGGFGFRVYGDPFIACRDFYMTMLPATCRWDYVGVSYARFYVRHWARYPSYLCYGGPRVHVHVGDGCHVCSNYYVSYRESCARPWEAFQPVPKFKQVYSNGARPEQWASGNARSSRVERVAREDFKGKGVARSNSREFTRTAKQVSKPSTYRNSEAVVGHAKPTTRAKSQFTATKPTKNSQRARVVSTSSARERVSVDRADVAALTKRTTPAVRSSHSEDSSKRAVANSKAARSESSRAKSSAQKSNEKGSKKKQAR